MNDRGMWTEKYKEKYGLENVTELRLIPYLQYLILNQMPVDPNKIDHEERQILTKWRQEGKIDYSMTHACKCIRSFWDWMNDVLWESYALHLEETSNKAEKD